MIDDGSGDMRTPFLDKLLPRTQGGLLSNGICDANVLLQSVCPTETFSYVSYCIEVKYKRWFTPESKSFPVFGTKTDAAGTHQKHQWQ